jgi:coproporphyrinogen III oxidase
MKLEPIDNEKNIAKDWFRELRDRFCEKFEKIDGEKFTRKSWKHSGEGGGEMSTLRGNIFEKVGVNISTVKGTFKEDFRDQISGTEKAADYWASGISLVAHMKSPHVPAFHFNTRYIVTGKRWFGGGADMTPAIPNKEDVSIFHKSIEKVCNKHNENYYKDFKKQCDEYFYLPHRDEPRGEGGIFFDHLNNNNFETDFSFVHDFGEDILETISEIIEKRMNKKWSDKEKDIQLYKRGRYVEFNLLWDRGTLFGLKTGGSTEAILMSMPPNAKWK